MSLKTWFKEPTWDPARRIFGGLGGGDKAAQEIKKSLHGDFLTPDAP